MATVGELLILIAGNNAPLTAAIASSEAQLRGFSATAGTQGAAAAGSMRSVGLAAGAMALATAAATAGSINAAADFQDQLAIINTIAHQTPDELNRTGEAIRAMSVASGEPLESLTGAFYDLLSAGVPVSQAMAVLQQSTTLAIGGLATTKQTVDLLTTAMNAYGLNTAGVTRATDQFALAIQDGKVTADQIAASFANVAPIAKTAGINIAEIAAAYAVMTARGVPAAEIPTQMNRAITELLKPNADLIALQERTGIVFANVARERGLVVALQEMREAAKANDVPFQELFGRLEGWKFALATTGPEFKKYQDELAAMGSATGTASAQAAERMETFNRSGAVLGNSLGDLATEIGTGFLPQATALVQQVSQVVQGVAAWARENPGLANTILLVVTGLSAMVAGVIFLGPIVGALAAAFGILTSPITLVAGAIAALAAHFGLLGEGPKAFVDGLGASLSNLLPTTGPVRDAFNLIGQAIDAIPGVIAGAQAAIGDFVSSVQAVWTAIGPDVVSGIAGAFSTFTGIIGQAASAFGPLISDVAQFLTSAGFLQAVTGAISNAFSILRGAVDGVVAVISTVVGWITTFITHLAGARSAGGTASSVFDGFAAILRTIATVFGDIVSVISTVVTAIVDAGNRTGFFHLVLDGLKLGADTVNLALGFFADILRTMFTLFGDVAGVVSGAVSAAFGALKGVIEGLGGIISGIVDALRTLIDFAGQAAAAVGSIGGPSGAAKDFQDRFRDVYGRNPTRAEQEQFRLGTLPGFAEGGIVPGPVGAPQLAVVHGGETITPPGQGGGAVHSTRVIRLEVDRRVLTEIVDEELLRLSSGYTSGLTALPGTTGV